MGDLYVGQSYHLKLLCKQAYHKNQESWEDVTEGTSALWENSLLSWQISFLRPFLHLITKMHTRQAENHNNVM